MNYTEIVEINEKVCPELGKLILKKVNFTQINL